MIMQSLCCTKYEDAEPIIRQALMDGATVSFGGLNYTFTSDVLSGLADTILMPHLNSIMTSSGQHAKATAAMGLDAILLKRLDHVVEMIMDMHEDDIKAEIRQYRSYGRSIHDM